MDISFAVITCSDTRDLTRDEAGAALERLVLEAGWSVASHVVVKDEQEQIALAIVGACDQVDADIVITCGERVCLCAT